MNVGVRAADEGRIEVLAQDLPRFGVAQLDTDITLRCALSGAEEPHTNAADVDGAVLARAPADKQATHPELLTGRCRLVMAIETGGRWSSEAADFVVFAALDADVVDDLFLSFCFLSGEPFRQVDRW